MVGFMCGTLIVMFIRFRSKLFRNIIIIFLGAIIGVIAHQTLCFAEVNWIINYEYYLIFPFILAGIGFMMLLTRALRFTVLTPPRGTAAIKGRKTKNQKNYDLIVREREMKREIDEEITELLDALQKENKEIKFKEEEKSLLEQYIPLLPAIDFSGVGAGLVGEYFNADSAIEPLSEGEKQCPECPCVSLEDDQFCGCCGYQFFGNDSPIGEEEDEKNHSYSFE